MGYISAKTESDKYWCATWFFLAGIGMIGAGALCYPTWACYYQFGSSEVLIKNRRFKEKLDIHYYHYVQRGYYVEHSIIGVTRKVYFILLSKHKLTMDQITKANQIKDPYIIKIKQTPKAIAILQEQLPPDLQNKLQQALSNSVMV